MAGQLDGDVNADKLKFASTAIITGEITAQSLTIDGRILGSIVADKVCYRQRRILKGSCTVRTLPLMMASMLTQNSPRSR
jgi:cytoskeletal protein CcmA (bactofilin family)